jgi:hypothetical protein
MNKSIALRQLPLPADIIDYICSFIYFTPFQSMIRTMCKYSFVVNNIHYLVRVAAYESIIFPCSSICYYHKYDTLKIHFVMCNWCGEYIRNEKCSCHY